MAPHSSTLAWKIPWTEEPGRLQSMGSLRVGHDWSDLAAAAAAATAEYPWCSSILLPLTGFSSVFKAEYYSTVEKEMATHSSILAWKIPCTEEPGRLQFMGLGRVRLDWETEQQFVTQQQKTNSLCIVSIYLLMSFFCCKTSHCI